MSQHQQQQQKSYYPDGTLKRELSYEELIEQFDLIPRTFIPGLMIRLTEVGYNKQCFRPGGASMLVRGAEARIPGVAKALGGAVDALMNCTDGLPDERKR